MNENNVFKLGTRGSPLALWQAERVKSLLEAKRPGAVIELVIIQTSGDKILDKPLVQIGGKGVFTKEIEESLIDGAVDFAVHSFKDLPTIQPPELAIVSIPERDSPFDAILSRSAANLRDLSPHPVIATGSLRRRAQILALRPDANVVDLRGNVNTRMRKYRESNWDAMIMALAGIRRMGWEDQISGALAPEEMLPAPAQGALAIEARQQDERTRELLLSIHDEATAAGVLAERAFLATLEGGCQVPMAAYAEMQESVLTLHGLIAGLDGAPCIRQMLQGDAKHPIELGKQLGENILQAGGWKIIASLQEKNIRRE
ncbi:MAG: hydroxymethylbilane synthase [Candidatus Omnitrophota bacterium]